MDINDFKEEAQNVYCFRYYNKDLTDVVPAILHPTEFNRKMQKFYKVYKNEIKTTDIRKDSSYQKWVSKMKKHNQSSIQNKFIPHSKKKANVLIKKQDQLNVLINYLDFNDIKTFFNISYNVGLTTKDLNALKELGYIYTDENNSIKCNFTESNIFNVAVDMIRNIEQKEIV